MGQTALPGTKSPDVVVITVKAYVGQPVERAHRLEKIVLQSGSELSENKNHLLILTAVKVMDYINRLNNYDKL